MLLVAAWPIEKVGARSQAYRRRNQAPGQSQAGGKSGGYLESVSQTSPFDWFSLRPVPDSTIDVTTCILCSRWLKPLVALPASRSVISLNSIGIPALRPGRHPATSLPPAE